MKSLRYGGLYDGRGADTINGSEGNDRIVASDIEGTSDDDNPQEDRVYAGPGDDDISVTNHPTAARDVVDCGEGHDRVHVDYRDEVSSNCEDVVNDREEVERANAEGVRIREATEAYERHMTVGASGELEVDDSEALAQENIASEDREFRNRALEETNAKIRAGEIRASDVFPSRKATGGDDDQPTGRSAARRRD